MKLNVGSFAGSAWHGDWGRRKRSGSGRGLEGQPANARCRKAVRQEMERRGTRVIVNMTSRNGGAREVGGQCASHAYKTFGNTQAKT